MDISFYSGDSRNLVITVVDSSNQPIDITGATIEWILANQNATLLSKSVGSGIIINNPSGGQFTISLSANETKTLGGTYQHMCRVTSSDGSSSIVLTGTVTINKALI